MVFGSSFVSVVLGLAGTVSIATDDLEKALTRTFPRASASSSVANAATFSSYSASILSSRAATSEEGNGRGADEGTF
jgi:hypothetical protein